MMFWHRIRVEYRFLIDWPRGRYGYIPWTRRERTCGWTYYRGRGEVEVRIDLEATWKLAKLKARRKHRNQFQTFLSELVDDLAHETHHAYEPYWTRFRKAEHGAVLFGARAKGAMQ